MLITACVYRLGRSAALSIIKPQLGVACMSLGNLMACSYISGAKSEPSLIPNHVASS